VPLSSAVEDLAGLHVLRLCSVFEPAPGPLDDRAARFDPIGGMQNHTAALSRCLDAIGVRQTVVTARLAGPSGAAPLGGHGTVRRVGVAITRFRQLWGWCALPYVVTARRPVDVVHAHQGEDLATLLLALVARALHRCSLVVTLHCSVRHTVTGRSPRARVLRVLGGAVEQQALRRAAAVITLVPHTAALLHDDGIPDDLVHVLPSGFDPGLFVAPDRDAFPELPRPRIGYVGRLAEQKRPDLLVDAFGRMRESSACLVIVGDGPLRRAVQSAVGRSPARDQITLTGFVPHTEVPAVLGSLDVLVLPSVYEEMGSVLVEAMASGLPVVASRVGGIPDVVADGETGLLVPPGDADALAAALDALVSDPQRRERLAAAARRRARRYSWPDLARRVGELYVGSRPPEDPGTR
jgi:glycogen(starch) synthase